MTGNYESLETVLRTIEAKKDLNKYNIIEKIQEKLKEQNQDLYKEWKKDEFGVNHAFDIFIYGKQTLLMIAAENGCTKTVEVLLKEGADVNAKDEFDRTALHFAAIYGCKEIVEVLIGAGADVNVRDKSGYTALHFILRKEIVEVLIGAKADVNAKDGFDRTALHWATIHARKEIVEVLLGAGADVNAVDKYGKTPLDYAKNQDVVKALLDAGGRSSVEEHNNKAMIVKARNKAMIAGGVNTLLGTAIAVALFTTGTITAQLTPIVIAVVAVTAAALVVGCATYALLKPSTKVGEAEEPSAVLTTNEQQGAA